MADQLSKKELRNYIEEQLDSGITVGHITDHLVKHGHNRDELEKIFDSILDEEEARKRGVARRAAEVLYIVFFAIFVLWVGISSESPGEAVIIGFLPTIAFIAIAILIGRGIKRNIFMGLPLLFAFLFYISGTLSNIPPFVNMEVAKLAFLNLMLSYIYIMIINSSSILGQIRIPEIGGAEEPGEEDTFRQLRVVAGPERIEEKPKTSGVYVEIPEKHESLTKTAQSIESNSKALNSVIGRVYRRSNGGTNLVRELIQVKAEWYNSFNHLLKNLDDKHAIYEMVDKIEKRLNQSFRKEHELFGTIQFRNLKRDPSGNSRIIDVLMMNDNDPVQTYFENALMACGDVKGLIGAVK